MGSLIDNLACLPPFWSGGRSMVSVLTIHMRRLRTHIHIIYSHKVLVGYSCWSDRFVVYCTLVPLFSPQSVQDRGLKGPTQMLEGKGTDPLPGVRWCVCAQ